MSGPGTPLPWAVHSRFPDYVVPANHSERPVGGAADDAEDLREFAQEVCSVGLCKRHKTAAEVTANTRYIVHACNLYPELLEALEKCVSHYALLTKLADSDRVYEVEKASGKRVRKPLREVVATECEAANVFLRAVIAKAHGEGE